MWPLFKLILLALSFTTATPSEQSQSAEASIERNSVGTCKWSVRTGSEDSLGSNAGSLVAWKFQASAEELSAYESLTETKTLANALLGTSKRAVRWGKVKQLSWQLPADHPRQNRSNCVALAAEAGRDGSSREFYTASRRLYSEFIVYQARDALIDEKGVLGLSCGYVQAHEACETHYKFIGRNWINSCYRDLGQARVAWEDMFRNPERHAGTCLKAPVPPSPTNASVGAGAGAGTDAGVGMTTITTPPTPPSAPPLPHRWVVREKVFAITAGWDNNYHHFLVDSLARLMRHYDWLQKHPDVLIHIRGFEVMAKKERFVQGGRDMRSRILQLLRLDPSRFITGPTLARMVWVPRATKCNAPMSHALELRLLARRMMLMALGANGGSVVSAATASASATTAGTGTGSSSSSGVGRSIESKIYDLFAPRAPLHSPLHRRPRVIMQHRHCQSELACKREKWREMNASSFSLFRDSVQRVLRPSDLFVFSSSDAKQKLPSALPSEIAVYTQADILIGAHGAGLTNILFMRPGSLVAELVGDFDGRMAPVCGYHGPLAAVFGVHHYLHYFDYKDISRDYKEIYPLKTEHFDVMTKGILKAWETLQRETRGEGWVER